MTGLTKGGQKSGKQGAVAACCQQPGATKANPASCRKPPGSPQETIGTTGRIGPCYVFLIIHWGVSERTLMKSYHIHSCSGETTDSQGWRQSASAHTSSLLCISHLARLLQAKRLQRHFVPCLRASSLFGITGLGRKSHQYVDLKPVNRVFKKKKKMVNIKVSALKNLSLKNNTLQKLERNPSSPMFNLYKTKLKEKKCFCSFSSMELSLIKQDCYTFLF